jgi:hypothetical protein
VVQLFTFPFQKPWVYVADFREAHDVMLRRPKEFDRSVPISTCTMDLLRHYGHGATSAAALLLLWTTWTVCWVLRKPRNHLF